MYLHTTPKLQVVYERFTYQTTVLLLEMYIFWVTTVCGILLASYDFKHPSQFLSQRTFRRYIYIYIYIYTCTYTYNLETMDLLHIEWLSTYWLSTYQMTALLSDISVFLVRAGIWDTIGKLCLQTCIAVSFRYMYVTCAYFLP